MARQCHLSIERSVAAAAAAAVAVSLLALSSLQSAASLLYHSQYCCRPSCAVSNIVVLLDNTSCNSDLLCVERSQPVAYTARYASLADCHYTCVGGDHDTRALQSLSFE